MILALDIGGTKTLWTIWNNSQVIDRGQVPTNTIKDFTEFIKTLIDEFESSHHDAPSTHKITRLSLAFAGPVTGTTLELTNTGQQIDLVHIRTAFPHMEVIALNDLEALAHSISHLTGSEQLALFRSAASSAANGALHDAKGTLHDTKGAPAGAKAVLSIGTGLGVAAVSREGIVIPSEGGHIDFAPIGAKQCSIYDKLSKQYVNIPESFEPPVRTFRATVPAPESR